MWNIEAELWKNVKIIKTEDRGWKSGAHPDFTDGVTQAFVGAELAERHGVKLAFVQVGHWSFPLLLTQRTGRIQSVLKGVTANIERDATRRWERRQTWLSRRIRPFRFKTWRETERLTPPLVEIRSRLAQERKVSGTSVQNTQKEEITDDEFIQHERNWINNDVNESKTNFCCSCSIKLTLTACSVL